MCTNLWTEYFIVIDEIVVNQTMTLGISSAQEGWELQGLHEVLMSTGISHTYRLTHHYFVIYSQADSSKIGMYVI